MMSWPEQITQLDTVCEDDTQNCTVKYKYNLIDMQPCSCF